MVGNLFGTQETTTEQRAPTGFQSLPGFGQEAFEQAITTGQELAAQPGLFAPAGLTAQQQQALGTLSSGLSPTSPEAFQRGLSTFGDPFQEQVIQNAIRDIREAGAGQFSDIGTLASAAGGFGGTRQALLESGLQQNIQRNIGDVSSQLRSQGFQAAADRTLQDIARSQQLAPTLFQLGDVERQIQTQQQQAPIAATQFLSNLAGGLPTGGGTSPTTQTAPVSLGDIGQLAAGVGGAALAFSDKRLKDNIIHKGQEKGFNIYEFQYKNSPQRYIGVIAQEIFEKIPSAVKSVSGYLAVDYDMIGIKMRTV